MTEEAKTAGEVNPIGEIRIQMNDQAIVFKPTDDITGNEVARLMVMFMNGLLAKSPVDFGSYINQYNLGKHFSLLPEETKAQSKED